MDGLARPLCHACRGHETVAGGAAFAAMHEWEKYQKKQGQDVDHGFAKEAVAGLAGAEVDKLFETHGLDWIDKVIRTGT